MLLFLCFIWHNAAYFLPTFLLFSVFFHNPFYFLKYFTKLFACLVLPPHIMGNAPSFTLGGKSIVPFQYAFSTHGHNLSAAFRQHHYKCVFDTWCFLRQGLLQRNDVADIITISGAATIFICLQQRCLGHHYNNKNCGNTHRRGLRPRCMLSAEKFIQYFIITNPF